MPAHVPGERADAYTVGFDWNDPRNQVEVAKHAPAENLITRVRKLIATEVASDKEGSALLATVLARNLDEMEKLPPFPLRGTNGDLDLGDLRQVLVVWGTMKAWMSTPQEFVALGPPSDGFPDGTPMPFTVSPLDLFRRVMTLEQRPQ